MQHFLSMNLKSVLQKLKNTVLASFTGKKTPAGAGRDLPQSQNNLLAELRTDLYVSAPSPTISAMHSASHRTA